MKARKKNPGLHRVGQQLGTELRKRRVKGTVEKDLVRNDHEDSARSSGVTGTPWPIAPVLIRRKTTIARPGDSDVTPFAPEFPLSAAIYGRFRALERAQTRLVAKFGPALTAAGNRFRPTRRPAAVHHLG
jgi:hypothetical protein